MSSCFSQRKLARLFKVATICMYWRPRCLETWAGKRSMNPAGFGCPKVCKKILCLHSPILKVHSTKTSGPLWFLEIGKQFASKNCRLQLTGSVFKDYDVHHVQSLQEKMEDLDSLSLNYWLTTFVQRC